MCFCQYLMSPWPPSFSLAPSPTSYVDIIYDHLPCSDCQVHLALTITEVWLRKDNSPVAIRLLLEQAGTSFGLDKPHQMLSIAPAAQGDVLPPFSSTDRIPFTDQSQSLNETKLCHLHANLALNFLLIQSCLCTEFYAVSQDVSTITNSDAACIYLHSFDRNFIL